MDKAKQVSELNMDEPEQYSVFGTVFWMLALSLGTSSVIALLIIVPMMLIGYEGPAVLAFLDKPNILLMTSVLTLLISYPLLKIATFHSLEKGLPRDFLAIKPIQLTTLSFWLGVALLVGMAEHWLIGFLEIPVSESMVKLKASVDHLGHLVLVVCSIVVLIPILEELVFRGMAYHRIEHSRFGTLGALVIPTLVFNFIHVQYPWLLLLVMLPGSFLLAYARYKTGNVNYSIAMHMLLNAISLWFLFS